MVKCLKTLCFAFCDQNFSTLSTTTYIQRGTQSLYGVWVALLPHFRASQGLFENFPGLIQPTRPTVCWLGRQRHSLIVKQTAGHMNKYEMQEVHFSDGYRYVQNERSSLLRVVYFSTEQFTGRDFKTHYNGATASTYAPQPTSLVLRYPGS